jgi:hypothetical protein
MRSTKMLFSKRFLCGLDSDQLYTQTIHVAGLPVFRDRSGWLGTALLDSVLY